MWRRIHDLYSSPMEWLGGARRRRRLLRHAQGHVLEVGIGTGLNLEHYPAGVDITGIDVSPRMLARAHRRATDVRVDVDLEVADVEQLPVDDDRFETVTATCVFCSVADPVDGLRELARVVRPHGLTLLLEHVRPRNPASDRTRGQPPHGAQRRSCRARDRGCSARRRVAGDHSTSPHRANRRCGHLTPPTTLSRSTCPNAQHRHRSYPMASHQSHPPIILASSW